MTSTTFDRDAAITRSLLGYGLVAGPFYLIVSLIEAFTRDGFDLARHSLSLLANGSWGWVHITMLVLTGLMVLAAAVGFARAPGVDGHRGPAWALGVFGLGLGLSGVFVADPMEGFPVGTPDGPPEEATLSGVAHLAVGGIGFLAVAVAAFLLGRIWQNRGDTMAGQWSRAAAVVILVAFVASVALNSAGAAAGVLLLWVTVLVIWAWLAWASTRLYRTVPHPDGPAPG